MNHTILADRKITINLAPETLTEEIIQNIAMILSTPKGTVPLDRDFGLSVTILDRPTVIAESLIVTEIYDAIEKYEPRAEIINVDFVRNEQMGKVIPSLEVRINDN